MNLKPDPNVGSQTPREPSLSSRTSAPTLGGLTENSPVAALALPALGHFVLMQKLGAGGMGTVYAAYDDRLDRRVAIKLLHVSAANQLQWQIILREAKALARVSHPNVVAIYEVGEASGQAYLAMEFVDGITLAAWQNQSRRSWQELLSIYLQAGQGLLAAHQAKLVHRDFKPNNVLVGTDGRARVVDFGLARVGILNEPAAAAVQGGLPGDPVDSDLTGDGVLSGTPGYMSPEQYLGGKVDSRSDQWSFSAALYEALYGRLPFGGNTVEEVAANVLCNRPELPAASAVPIEVYHILARGLATQPEQRFPSMAELLQALAHEQGDSPAGAAMARRRALIPIVSLGVGLSALAQVRAVNGGTPIAQAAVSSLILLGIGTVLCWVLRRALLRNAFHRRLVIILMTTTVQNLVQRLIALRLGMAMYNLFPLEMVVWAGSITLIASSLLPALRWLPGILLAAAGAAVLLPRSAVMVLGLAYPLIIISIALAWTNASARGPALAGRGTPRRDGLAGVGGAAEPSVGE